MESYKDVIVSSPPPMYSKSSYTTNITLENYKGILLCDRPYSLPSSVGMGGESGEKAFVPPNRTGNPLGLAPSAEELALRHQRQALREKNSRNSRNQSREVLNRHKQWLRSFAQQVKRMKSDDLQREVEQARKKERLRQMQVQKERLRRENEAQASPPPEPYNMYQQMDPHKAASKSSQKGAKKPKWAMTEEEALDDEFSANDGLLDFAQRLDYDKFINDYEVTEALAVMRDRVLHIAKANDWTEDDILRAADAKDEDDLLPPGSPSGSQCASERYTSALRHAAPPAETSKPPPGSIVQHVKGWDSSRGTILKRAISNDALALAERMLASTPSLQKIHTKNSLARALQWCALNGNADYNTAIREKQSGRNAALDAMGQADLAAATAIGPTGGSEPTVQRVTADAMAAGGAAGDVSGGQPARILCELQKSTERTQGLPYLYRCPAI